MESFNFGAFDTQLPGRIAAIPQEAQKQQSANMLQAIQMQGAMRQNEMSQMQLDELKTDRAEMVKLQQNLAAKGGSPDLNEYADLLMRSPKHIKLGIELKQKLSDQARYDKIMSGGAPPAAAAPAPAPMAPPAEPGSFGADVAERRAADPFASRTNMLPGAAAAPAGVNALAGGNEAVAEMRRKRDALQSIDTPQARAAVKTLTADIALASKPPAYQNVPGVGLVNPVDKSVVVPSVEATAPNIREYEYAKKQGFKGSLLDYRASLARAGRAQAATEGKPLTALQTQKAKATQVAQNEVVRSSDASARELETLADKLVGNAEKKIPPHEGLSGITGYMGLLPSLPSGDARNAAQQLDTFKGKVMAFGRLLATQQGKLGNMAVSEWKFISDAVEKIDPLAKNFPEQLRDVVRQAKDFAASKRETFNEQYDTETPAAAAPALSSADQQALTWATANPKDPRSAQIKQRLGR